MDAIYSRQLQLPMSYCNHLGNLSYTDTCTIFMNAACADAENRGFGLTYIQQRNLFWLTVHAKYRFYRMPAMLTDVTIRTWPGKLRFGLSKRYYTLQDENGLCAEALTDWALYDNSEQKITSVLDKEFSEQAVNEKNGCDPKRANIDKDFTGCDIFGTYTVTSNDIDLGQHMNNVAYIRMLFGMMSTEEVDRLNLFELDISYLTPVLEGTSLTVYVRKKEDGNEYGIFRSETPCTLIKLIKKENHHE